MAGKIYQDMMKNKIVDGINGLDLEDGTWVDPHISVVWIVAFVLLALIMCVWLYFLMVWLCCPP